MATTRPIEAVVAGSKAFADALLAPIAKRVGAPPSVARDAAHALLFCGERGGIVVVEFLGEDSLSAIQDLVLEGGGLRIIAAVPAAHAAAVGPLRALGVEPVRWDGRPEGVIGALDRLIASALAPPRPEVRRAPAPAAPPAAAPRPHAPAPARAAGPSLTPSRPQPRVRPPPPGPERFGPLDAEILAAAESLGAPAAPAPPPAAPAASGAPLAHPHEPAFDVDLGEALAAAHAPAADDAPWPTAVPGPVEAADALGRALLGDVPAPGTPLAAVAAVVTGLSELERAVFSGEPQPFDTEGIRRAAVMRVRVAVALATAPAPGGAVDHGAVSALLAEIDGLLSDVNGLAAGAPPRVQLSLEVMRNALVKEAIDFSEAVQRAGAAEPVAAVAVALPHPRAAPTRVISMTAETAPRSRRGRHAGLTVLLALAALAAGGFHGYRYWSARNRIRQVPTLPALTGAVAIPDRAGGAPSGPRAIAHVSGEAFDPRELEAFTAAEAKKGNVVKQIAPGTILVVPAAPATPPEPGTPGAR